MYQAFFSPPTHESLGTRLPGCKTSAHHNRRNGLGVVGAISLLCLHVSRNCRICLRLVMWMEKGEMLVSNTLWAWRGMTVTRWSMWLTRTTIRCVCGECGVCVVCVISVVCEGVYVCLNVIMLLPSHHSVKKNCQVRTLHCVCVCVHRTRA